MISRIIELRDTFQSVIVVAEGEMCRSIMSYYAEKELGTVTDPPPIREGRALILNCETHKVEVI